jgi:hypothetical protein
MRSFVNLYVLPNIIRIIRSRRMRWTGQVECMGEIRYVQILFGKPEGKRPLGRHRSRWENSIRTDHREIGWEDMDWIHLAQVNDL